MLGILDYNAGNQTSVRRALDAQNIPSRISADPADLASCQGIIFPGVGAAGTAMQELERTGLARFLNDAAREGRPILGICLGCQILLDHSEENDTDLLGIVRGKARRFPDNGLQEDGSPAPVPHMGWNTVERHIQSPLFQGIPENAFFYFVHSYYVDVPEELVIGTTHYTPPFCSVYGRDGLWGVQFHPEKSGRHGLALLRNFYTYCMGAANAV